MTREEEIRNAIDTIIPILPSENGRTYEQALMATGLEEGIRWADEHPINMWHDTNEEPKEHSKIVIIDTKGEWWNIDYASDDFEGYGLYGWTFCIAHYELKIWAYIDDLLPKGCEK